MFFLRKPVRVLPLLTAMVLLAACASSPPANTDTVSNADAGSKAALKQRVMQRWEYLIAGQAGQAYDYLTPGYRATISREQYAVSMNNRPTRWKSADITKLECAQAGNCQAYVSVKYTLMIPARGAGLITTFAPLTETWLLLRNQWYYLPSEDG